MIAWTKAHKIWAAWIAVVAVLAIIGLAGVGGGSSAKPTAAPKAAPSTSAPAKPEPKPVAVTHKATPKPAKPVAVAKPAPTTPAPVATTPAAPATPTMVSQTDIVVFSVTGTGEPSIQYGNGATTNNPSEGAGPLSDGNYLPWHASMTYSAGAEYYAVTAQLEGSGSISDTVTEVVTTQCSDGTHTESFPLANGSASGGYGIAQAEYAGGDTGNATQAESDAGC